MKVAFYIPGLRYKPSSIKREMLDDKQVISRLAVASEAINRDILGMCRDKQLCGNTTDCFVITLALAVSHGEYYWRAHQVPDMVVSSSIGHYGGLVLTGSLKYKAALDVLKQSGEIFDQHFSDYMTILVEGASYNSLVSLFAKQEDIAVLNYKDGIGITFPKQLFNEVTRDVTATGTQWQEAPLRLPYHTPYVLGAEAATRDIIEELEIETPQLPFMTTSYAKFISLPSEIKSLLKVMIASRNDILKTRVMMKREGVTQRVYIGPGCLSFQDPFVPGR